MPGTNATTRRVYINGVATNINVELEFWNYLGEIAESHGVTKSVIVERIKEASPAGANLSSAVRVFLFGCLRDERHLKASPWRKGNERHGDDD